MLSEVLGRVAGRAPPSGRLQHQQDLKNRYTGASLLVCLPHGGSSGWPYKSKTRFFNDSQKLQRVLRQFLPSSKYWHYVVHGYLAQSIVHGYLHSSLNHQPQSPRNSSVLLEYENIFSHCVDAFPLNMPHNMKTKHQISQCKPWT